MRSNKSAGTEFEKRFASILSQTGFWVHIFQDNKNGQPCDVIAARDGDTYLFDCKRCETKYFRLDRMEENQYNAMKLFHETGNQPGRFAVRYPDGDVILIGYDRIRQLQNAGTTRLDKETCAMHGTELGLWLALKSFGIRNRGDDNENSDRKRDPDHGSNKGTAGLVQ